MNDKIQQKYVSKVGSEITTIDSLDISPCLQILNLHCNKIARISGLDKTQFLQSLDLSGNQITKITGLNCLTNLRNLNLACNLITCIENLSNQRLLTNLNLSYNDIHLVDGLSVFSNEHYSLQCLLLHGNQISGIERFKSTVEGCRSLKTLTLSYDGVSNPICLEKGYRDKIVGMSQIDNIDGHSRTGKNQIEIHNDYINAIFSSDETTIDGTLSAITQDSDISLSEYSKHSHKKPSRDRQAQIIKCYDKSCEVDILPKDCSTKSENDNKNEQKIENENEIIDSKSDEKNRNMILSCYNALTNDLERERERRIGAEKLNSKLTHAMNLLNGKITKTTKQLSKYSSTNSELKKYLEEQVKKYNELDEKYIAEKEAVKQKALKIEELLTSLSEYKEATTTLEQSLITRDAQIARDSAIRMKVENEKTIEVKASRREVDLLTCNNEKLKKQITTLQQVIANREQEFQKQKEGLYSIDSKDFEKILQDKICSTKSFYAQKMAEKDQKIKELEMSIQKQKEEYILNIEEENQKQYELQNAFKTKCLQNADMERAMEDYKTRENQSVSLIAELSNVVREQQKRHLDSTNQTHRTNEDLKRTSKDFEDLLHKHKILVSQNEETKKSKIVLERKLKGLEAVIEGLRAERALWSKELVNQGAMLSANRGRIEIKLENLEKELKNRKVQEEKLNDTIKIKTKMLDDQTEIIRKLKDGLTERDAEVKKLTNQVVSTSQDSEIFLNELEKLKAEFEKVRERKDALKMENQDLNEELADFTEAYNEINEKWEKRIEQIKELETNLEEGRQMWNEKEKKLKNERDRAVAAAEFAIKKMKEIETTYNEKYAMDKQEIEEFLKGVENAKMQQVDEIKQKNSQLQREIFDHLSKYNSSREQLKEKLEQLDLFV